jgi:hypothetical protein
MKCLRSTILLLLSFISIDVIAQSDNISLNDKQYNLLERLDIKLINDSILRFTTVKPFNRKAMTQKVEEIYARYKRGEFPNLELSDVDEYNISKFLESNADWTIDSTHTFKSKRKPNYTGIFATSSHLLAVREKDYSFVLDPVFTYSSGKSTDGDKTLFLNTRGLTARGSIDHKIGFYTSIFENQEKDPQFVQDYVTKNIALPGYGFFKPYQTTGYDHFSANGGVSFNTGKYMDLLFAYDKLFIGNGYRSLFLSNFSTDYLFLRFRVHVGKLNYETIVAETVQPYRQLTQGKPQSLPHNYIGFHHLSWQVSKRVNIGFYENSTENGKDGIKLNYLNPFIFYKSIEQDNGNNGKTNIGFDFKYNAFRNVQFYGQLEFNEFVMNDVLHYSSGSWWNKQGAQMGIKYIDAFNIYNFDLQLEANLVRPYTYTAHDSLIGFTHYNQPLAHPLGANFREFIVIGKLQPLPKLYLLAKIFYSQQGLDSAGVNFGSNLFRSYSTRPRDYGFKIGSGILATTIMGSFSASYEVIPNLFLEGNAAYRKYDVQDQASKNDFYFTAGIRWNIARRDFEF